MPIPLIKFCWRSSSPILLFGGKRPKRAINSDGVVWSERGSKPSLSSLLVSVWGLFVNSMVPKLRISWKKKLLQFVLNWIWSCFSAFWWITIEPAIPNVIIMNHSFSRVK